jgi:hypothetical protein
MPVAGWIIMYDLHARDACDASLQKNSAQKKRFGSQPEAPSTKSGSISPDPFPDVSHAPEGF